MIIDEEHYLAHYGTLHKSGRYPWGSGETQNIRNKSFLDHVDVLKKQGLSEVDIAKGLGIVDSKGNPSTTLLRNLKSIANNEQKQTNINMAQKLQDKGLSNVAIGERMGINESSVRALLAPGAQTKVNILNATTNMLRDAVDKDGFIDVGAGAEHLVAGVSRTKLNNSIAVLKEEGYKLHYVKVQQATTGNETTLKVLTKPDVPYMDVIKNKGNIKQLGAVSDDNGRTFDQIKPPTSISLSRVGVTYKEQGGADADGVIYVRPGVDDVSLGASRYAQVRIAVDNTHYLKGMAMYKDDLPKGVDLQFNTNKSSTGNKIDALKELKKDTDGNVDAENPFGAMIKRQNGVMNIINEEGAWEKWSKNFSSQMLSKQSPTLAEKQLKEVSDKKQSDLDEILRLTNPTVRKKLLESYADDADSAAVHLKAAALPRTANHVILPIPTLKENEIYAPNFRDGERVALVRFPHGGTFEIPQLTVNNNHPKARSAIGDHAKDAVGIHPKVAERLSGADFDGDTVLVIPNDKGHIKSAPALEGLKDFDPKSSYPAYEGMVPMSAHTKQHQMGEVTNLIADMTIRGANNNELARAVRHSMVVIDAEKHNLDYKSSARENGINQLKAKYQAPHNATSKAGASTLITRATSEKRVAERKQGFKTDPTTGKKIFTETGNSFVDKNGKTVIKITKSTKLAETDDAHTLSSGTRIESVYADHSNSLKALANLARKEAANTKDTTYSPSAKAAYSNEAASLTAKLRVAERNAPLERQAQLIAATTIAAKKAAYPDLDKDQVKKVQRQALEVARARVGAGKIKVDITPDEWAAIQAGAISPTKLSNILKNADLDQVKKLATPKASPVLNAGKLSRAKGLLKSGATQAEVADMLGISLTTLKLGLDGGE